MDAWKKLAAAAMVVFLGSAFQAEAVAGGNARVNAAGRPVGLGSQSMGGRSSDGAMQNPARLVANRARNGLSKGTTGQYKAKTHSQHQVLSPNQAGGQRKNADNRH